MVRHGCCAVFCRVGRLFWCNVLLPTFVFIGGGCADIRISIGEGMGGGWLFASSSGKFASSGIITASSSRRDG